MESVTINEAWACLPGGQAGCTRTDKIGVGADADLGGTGISCNFMARQYTGPTRQSYRDDVGDPLDQ
jgi:hypothetical protein